MGQVDKIHYDYTRDSAFTVDISIHKDIALPAGTQLALVSDGLLGGMALELQFPSNSPEDGLTAERSNSDSGLIEKGTFLPTTYVPGLVESLQTQLLAHVDEAVQDVDQTVQNVDSLVAALRQQVQGNHIKHSLANVDRVSSDLTSVSANLKQVMNNQVPRIINNADTAIATLNTVVSDIQAADLKATVARVDTTVDNVNRLVTQVRSPIMNHIDAAILSADSLLTDLKAHPKRYVHFSIFGKKDK